MIGEAEFLLNEMEKAIVKMFGIGGIATIEKQTTGLRQEMEGIQGYDSPLGLIFFPNLIELIQICLHSIGKKIHFTVFVAFGCNYSIFNKDIKMMSGSFIIYIQSLS